MLGKQIHHGRRKFVGMRVTSCGKMELTSIMQGLFLGEDTSVTYSMETEMRPDGTRFSEGRGLSTTKDGKSGRYKIMGNVLTKPDGSRISRGVVCFSCPPGKFA